MILGVGTDIVDARRIGKSIDRFSDKFTRRIFTKAERAAAAATGQPKAYLAKRFAAKEAVYKALTGAGVAGFGNTLHVYFDRFFGLPGNASLHRPE